MSTISSLLPVTNHYANTPSVGQTNVSAQSPFDSFSEALVAASNLANLPLGPSTTSAKNAHQSVDTKFTIGAVSYTPDQIKSFFATNPQASEIADGAANLGMTKAQIEEAMQIGGFLGGDAKAIKSNLETWVNNSANGYGWSTTGSLMKMPNGARYVAPGEGAMTYDSYASSSLDPKAEASGQIGQVDLVGSNQVAGNREGGRSVLTGLGQSSWTPNLRYCTGASQGASCLNVNGKQFSKQQLQDLYDQGIDDVQWLQQNGVTDAYQLRALTMQARDIAGNAPQGENALKYYFSQYKSENPSGSLDFATWKGNLGFDLRAIEMGTYLRHDTGSIPKKITTASA